MVMEELNSLVIGLQNTGATSFINQAGTGSSSKLVAVECRVSNCLKTSHSNRYSIWVNGTRLFWRWRLVVRVSVDGSIMEVQRVSRDSVNSNMIIVAFPGDLPNSRPHVSGTGSWIDVSKSCVVLL